MGKKEFLANVLWRFGLIDVLRFIRSEKPGDLTILAYHRILDVDGYKSYPYDIELVSASCEEFSWQMKHLKKYYNPITLLDVIDCLNSNTSLPSKAVVVTFDDGFDDNYYNAFQILKECQLAATFFISTDYLDNSETFWFDWLVFAVKKTTVSKVVFSGSDFVVQIPKAEEQRHVAINQIMKFLRELPDSERVKVFAVLKEQLNVEVSDNERKLSQPLTTNQVQIMAQGGMEIASHTKSHPMLSRLTEKKLIEEMAGSREVLNNIEGVSCDTISFPFGGTSAFNERVKSQAKKAGYTIACSYQSGVNNVLTDDKFQLKRLHVDYSLSRASFSAMLADPDLFGVKWLDGSVYES